MTSLKTVKAWVAVDGLGDPIMLKEQDARNVWYHMKIYMDHQKLRAKDHMLLPCTISYKLPSRVTNPKTRR